MPTPSLARNPVGFAKLSGCRQESPRWNSPAAFAYGQAVHLACRTVRFLGGEGEICKEHGPNYRHAVVLTVGGTHCAFRVAASADNGPPELSCECGGGLISSQGGCVP